MIRKIIMSTCLVVIGLIMLPFGIYICKVRKPVKAAIKTEDFHRYTNYILVTEDFATGTGWNIIGDEDGYFEAKDICNIRLQGSLPPTINSYASDFSNTFLCEGEFLKQAEVLNGMSVNTYYILDWHPVYPVKRYTILLPDWFYPEEYMNVRDLMGKDSW